MGSKQNNLIAGLDIGSSAVRMAIGQLVNNYENGVTELQILGTAEVPSEGMHRGTIRSIEDVVSAISACLETAERTVGVPIESVWLGVSGSYIMTQASRGVVAVSKADNEISEEDVARAMESARAISTPLNYDLLHVLPKTFGVDNQTGIKDPVGMTGIRLEAETQIVLGLSSQVKNLTKAVYRTGLDIEDLVFSILATSEVVITPRQKELGVAVVNLGASTTSVAVFEEGDFMHAAVLPIGSENITNDIALGLKTSIDIAERIKVEYGDCFSEDISKKDEIDLYDFGSSQHEIVRRKFLSEIIEARVEEILQKIQVELKKIQRNGLLPAGVVFTGRGASLPGILELAKKELRLPASVGYPLNILSVTDKINDLGFATAIGLVKWGSTMKKNSRIRPGAPISGSALAYLKKILKTLIP